VVGAVLPPPAVVPVRCACADINDWNTSGGWKIAGH
jgi:hypothetical protein